jgi:hypothetical protein
MQLSGLFAEVLISDSNDNFFLKKKKRIVCGVFGHGLGVKLGACLNPKTLCYMRVIGKLWPSVYWLAFVWLVRKKVRVTLSITM